LNGHYDALVAPRLTIDFITRMTGMNTKQALAAMDTLTNEGLILPQLEDRDILRDEFDVLVPLRPTAHTKNAKGGGR
jgi:hypothetical protein